MFYEYGTYEYWCFEVNKDLAVLNGLRRELKALTNSEAPMEAIAAAADAYTEVYADLANHKKYAADKAPAEIQEAPAPADYAYPPEEDTK